MTDHRDFKRRVRDRQARTGESYMIARRHVLAQRPQPPEDAISVVEVLDVTETAANLGFRCRVLVFPRLAAKVDTELLLDKVRGALLLTTDDKETDLLRALAFTGVAPNKPTRWMTDLVTSKSFVSRARAGIGGTTRDGYVLALHMAGRDGLVTVMCTAWHMFAGRPPTIVLTTIDELGAELWGREPGGADAMMRDYAEAIAAKAGVTSRAIIDAFAAVPRERFVGPGPWKLVVPPKMGYVDTPDASLAQIYGDVVIAIDPARELNNGQPSAHAKWIAAADPHAGDSVFHLGCGTGYFTAIFAEIVGVSGRVTACDVDGGLAARAAANLATWPQATAFAGDGTDLRGDHDVIYVNAGATHARREWLAALRPGGRLVMPLTMHVPQFPNHGVGVYIRIQRAGERWPITIVSQVGIFDCVGARDPALEVDIRGLLHLHMHDRLVVDPAPHEASKACLLHTDGFCVQNVAP
jgi:protein-L-isoaspartate(D-aspartate) O-methyltransferase